MSFLFSFSLLSRYELRRESLYVLKCLDGILLVMNAEEVLEGCGNNCSIVRS